ncbi:LysR family transcriptional regulator [Halobacteriovorax marinus]|uniref:LysR family transcriptional regulator n=1 Tax=Halobacteriovorax marinus TaxID=97084 RepID=UPI003A8DF529
MDLNLLKTFSKVSELGSFTKAAEALKQPKSRVSRAISRLEDEIGLELIRRTTRQTSLTTEGEAFYNKIKDLIHQLDEEIDSLNDSKKEISGVLRITAPEDLGQSILLDIIAKYNDLYPNVEVQTLLTGEYLDLTKDNIDLAFRVGKLEDSNLIQRSFKDVHFVAIASREYIQRYGLPKSTKDLHQHKLLTFKGFDFNNLNSASSPEALKYQINTSSIPMLLNMALEGNGISIVPSFYCEEYIRTGELVHLFPKWRGPKHTIKILYTPTSNLSKRTRAFLDLVKDFQ